MKINGKYFLTEFVYLTFHFFENKILLGYYEDKTPE